MKKLLNKLLISILIIIVIFNFIIIPQTQAISVGGILLKPITSILMVPLDNIAFLLTCTIGIFSNGLIDWASDWVTDAVDVIENSWASDQNLIDNIGNTLESAGQITGLGFLTIEDFFSGEIELSNINIFTSESDNNIIVNVKKSAAEWYYALRNISAIGLLCVLIYTAIRILLSTVAEEKAHYKDMLTDWIKAVCLVIFIHVLMILILNFTDSIVGILRASTNRLSSIAWARHELLSDWDTSQVVYLIMYGMLIYYTIVFAISYSKRFLYSVLLIVIAPVIGLVYAFGKEGKQIFQKWLKEFVSNAFLQPYHMVIYTVLFGFVASIAGNGKNMMVAIYSLIVLHFIKDAEKYYRSLFGMGSGVAGIGQADTGIQTIEKVKQKTVQVVQAVGKVALSAASLAIPASSIVSQAAAGQAAKHAAGAMDQAQDLGDIASRFRRGGGEGPEGDETDIPPRPDNPFGGGGGGAELELLEPPNTPSRDEEVDTLDVERQKVSDQQTETLDTEKQTSENSETREEAYRRSPFDGAVFNPREKEKDSLPKEGPDVKARKLEVDTITAQGVKTAQEDIDEVQTKDFNANRGKMDNIDGDELETDDLEIDETKTQTIEGSRVRTGGIETEQIEGSRLRTDETKTQKIEGNRVRTDQVHQRTTIEDIQRAKEARHTRVTGQAFDAMTGGTAGRMTASFLNKRDEIYQKVIEAGGDPHDPETQRQIDIETMNSIVNGDLRTADMADEGDMRYVPLEAGDRDDIGSSIHGEGDTYANLGVNSSTTNNSKAETAVEVGGTSANSTVNVAGISQSAMEKMIKDMIPGGKMSNAEITKIAQQVSQNVGGQVDSKQIESMIKSVAGGNNTTVNVQNIEGTTTGKKRVDVHVDPSEIEGKVKGKGKGSKPISEVGESEIEEKGGSGKRIAKDRLPDIGLPEGEIKE